MEENKNLCMDWGDSIENEGQEFVTLEEGDYVFKVTAFERGRYVGSAKIPPCNKATITVQVNTDKGIAICKFDLVLYRTLEWKLCSFFRSIGQKKHGEKLVMNWNTVIGSIGKAHFKPRTYTNQYGDEKVTNDIDRFIDYNEEEMRNFKFEEVLTPVTDEDLPF